MEELDKVQGMAALELFYSRMAGIVKQLQEVGKQETLVPGSEQRMVSLDSALRCNMLCRLEEHDEVQGMAALEQFDSRLAGAVKRLQELGKWEIVVARGGSSPHGLSLTSSKFDAEACS